MTICARALVAAVSILSLSAYSTQARIHKGFALIEPGPAWDFSDSVAVVPPDGDLYWVTLLTSAMRETGSSTQVEWFTTNLPALIAYAPQDSTYEELTAAPGDTTLYGQARGVFTSVVYVIRTKEYHYAKFRVTMIGGGGITIEYAYQDDGTRILVDPVPVRSATWGRVKGLYR